MAKEQTVKISEFFLKNEKELLSEWIKNQLAATSLRSDLMNEAELRRQSTEFLGLLKDAFQKDTSQDIMSDAWTEVRNYLGSLSRSRAIQGFTPVETATFIFSLKQPVFNRFAQLNKDDLKMQIHEIWSVLAVIDKLGLLTFEVYTRSREEVIARQQREMIELSTPVVQIWNGILALPLIGTLDSERTQVVMESLLTKIVETGSFIAIIDITGVPTVDTLVAQHLLKTVAAAKLMGAECIISGIRPQIAQTIVHLGVNLEDVITKASMSEAIKLALQRNNLVITKAGNNSVREK